MCLASAVTDVIDQDGLFTRRRPSIRAASASACAFAEQVAGFGLATFTVAGTGSSLAPPR